MKKNLFFLALVLFLPHNALSQYQAQTKSDSLLSALHRHAKEDTAKVNTLNALSREYNLINNSDTAALSYGQAALTLARKLNYKKGIATACRYIGNFYSSQPDSTLTLAYYKKALAICKQIDDKQGMIDNLHNIALVYQNRSIYPKSIAYHQQALDIAKGMSNQAHIASVYNDIGYTFMTASDYSKALEYYQKGLNISEKSGDKLQSAKTLSQIGWLYRNLGDSTHAVEYLIKSLNINRQLKNQQGIADCLSTLGNIYLNASDYKKSIEYYSESIEISKTMNDELVLAYEYANVAGLYQFQSDYTKASKYLDSARFISNKYHDKYGQLLYLQSMGLFLQNAPDSILSSINVKSGQRYQAAIENDTYALKLANELNIPIQKIQALGLLISAYEKQGNYKAAYLNIKNVIALRDSIKGQEAQKKVIQKEVQYAFEKKAAATRMIQEKKDIKQRTIRNSLITGLSVLIIFLIIVFRQRNKVKKEKKRSEDLLLNILPAKVADELKENGKAAAHRFDNITVLFTDFVNFTGVSETLSPEELVGELHECFTAFDNIIERNGLEKIKTIGDAYMAVCGLPNSREDHAQKTAQAATEIIDFMHNRSLKEKVFSIRIGINSGPVVAGIVGVKKFAYDIWGDAVNTAARMEQKSEPGRINVSEATYELIKDDFDCSFRGEIEAKNKGKLKMYFLESKQLQLSGKLLPV